MFESYYHKDTREYTVELMEAIADAEWQAEEADRMGYSAVPKFNYLAVLKRELRQRLGPLEYYFKYCRDPQVYRDNY